LVFDGACLHRIVGASRLPCLANVFRVLKPGGVFHAEANLVNEAITEPVRVTEDIHYDPVTRCLVWENAAYDFMSREEEFLGELRQAGFDIVRTERQPPRENADPYEGGSLAADAI